MSAGRFAAGGQVAVVGYAHSPIRRTIDEPLGALTIETCRQAVADAGLTMDQIDGFTTGAIFPSSGGRALVDGVHIVTADWLVEELGIRPRWLCGFQGVGQVPGAVILATTAIATGAADYVIVHRAMFNPPGSYHENPMTEAAGDAQWMAPQGYWGPISEIALTYMEYMQRYGATREEMATVVVEARRNGSSIPWSYWYGKPITVDDYMAARMIAEPMSVLDCDLPVSGVGAFVLTSAERARDLPHRPVYVAGFAQGRSRPRTGLGHWLLDEMMDGGEFVARTLWENTGLSRDDVDVPQLYDGFSPVHLPLARIPRLLPTGRGPPVRPGRRPSTRHRPSLPLGWRRTRQRAHARRPPGAECYLQLSRRAGERQLDRADVALACQAAPNFGGVVAYTAEPT